LKWKIFSFILKFRRELAILVWVFWLAHGIGAFMDYKILINNSKTYVEILFEPYVWKFSWYMFWWMLALIVSIPLLITSNWLSTKKLWKHWKTLQRLSYFMFVFVAIHIFLIKWEVLPLYIIWTWIIVFTLAYFKNKKLKTSLSVWPKWLCVPCGYIYDENIWDLDGWILPWTKFEDIPNIWICPVCGVWKKDFILLEENIEKFQSEVISLSYLNDNIIELKLDLKKELSYISWQFLNIVLKDDTWEFNRSYSIASKEGNIYTFLIKLKDNWKAWNLFKKTKVWDKILYKWIFGEFILKNTANFKVFIATWTWLAPIYFMLLNTCENISKKLYFWVEMRKDLFYLDKLKNIKNLEIILYLSKEEIEWFRFGRINLDNEEFDKQTEFYICWNPSLVSEKVEKLSLKWYENIYYEKFK